MVESTIEGRVLKVNHASDVAGRLEGGGKEGADSRQVCTHGEQFEW